MASPVRTRSRSAEAQAAPPAPVHDTPHDSAAVRRAELRAEALLVLMVLIWGVNYSVAKYGARILDPVAFNGMRVALAAGALWIVAFASGARWPSRRDALALLALGAFGNGLYQYLFIEGVARTRAGSAALVLATSPAAIALLERVRGTGRMTGRVWAGIALQLLGVGCVVLGGAAAAAGSGEHPALGAVILLGATVCWAIYSVALEPYTHRVGSIELSAFAMTGGAIPLVLVAAPAIVAAPWSSIGALGWGAVLYSGILSLVVAYLFWYRGVRVLGPTRTAMFGNLQPIVALLAPWIAIGEVPTAWQAAGAVAVMSGLFVGRGA